jgi:magnesium-transporting ATPase (P-type)
VFILIIILASLSTGFGSNWGDRFEDQHWYLKQSGLALTEKVGAFFAFVILYNTMIPISLYVTMEMIKLVQAYLISSDVEMFHELSATSARAKTSSLNEDLGQIAFLFSDKTGKNFQKIN